jgi:hypothetical protein
VAASAQSHYEGAAGPGSTYEIERSQFSHADSSLRFARRKRQKARLTLRTDISSACVSRRVTAGSGQSQQRMARAESFEQLRVLVGPGDTISVREPLRPRRRDSFFRLAAASDASDGP